MVKVFIVHGFEGQPNGGWRPWLMAELAKHDIYACALPMPTPDHPVKNEWIKTISDAIKNPTDEIFLIGHSLGVPAILHYIETLDKNSKIGGAILISGPIFEVKGDEYEDVNSFLNTSFDFGYIKNICNNFIVIHGDNDKIVNFSEGEYLSQKLSCDLIPIPNGGHLGGHDGWYQFPKLLESLLKMIK